MTLNNEHISQWVEENSSKSNIEFLEALDIWTEIPAEILEIYDKDDLIDDIFTNLSLRYRKKDAREAIELLFEGIDEVLEIMDYERAIKDLSTALNESGQFKLLDSLIERLHKDKKLKSTMKILADYIEEKDLWEYFIERRDRDEIDSQFRNANLSFTIEDLVAQGIIYKLRLSELDDRLIVKYVLSHAALKILDEIVKGTDISSLYECEYCQSRFTISDELNVHQEQCEENPYNQESSWICTRCNQSFDTREEASEHSTTCTVSVSSEHQALMQYVKKHNIDNTALTSPRETSYDQHIQLNPSTFFKIDIDLWDNMPKSFRDALTSAIFLKDQFGEQGIRHAVILTTHGIEQCLMILFKRFREYFIQTNLKIGNPPKDDPKHHDNQSFFRLVRLLEKDRPISLGDMAWILSKLRRDDMWRNGERNAFKEFQKYISRFPEDIKNSIMMMGIMLTNQSQNKSENLCIRDLKLSDLRNKSVHFSDDNLEFNLGLWKKFNEFLDVLLPKISEVTNYIVFS
ncbi:MAG: hypothetical protein ACTSWA_01600 [Candidatus Thorarchaeota archaeon]